MDILIPHFNDVYLGDNLSYLQVMEDESVDLIYCDPPFGTGKIYTNEGEFVFSDKNSLVELIEFLLPRIKECFRILKPTGSFWLHGTPVLFRICGWNVTISLISAILLMKYRGFISSGEFPNENSGKNTILSFGMLNPMIIRSTRI